MVNSSNKENGRRVAIIGGGAAGLASLRTFQEVEGDWNCTLFESRKQVGGIWYTGDDMRPEDPTTIPSTAAYDTLTTNLPCCVMMFNHYLFPPHTKLFPSRLVVQQYLVDYASAFNLWQDIRLGESVEEAIWTGNVWTVQTIKNNNRQTHHFDHLVMANGHYSRPSEPLVPGLSIWKAHANHRVIHSMWYREPSGYQDRRVLVIGGGASGRDIAREISRVASAVFWSVKGGPRSCESNPQTRPAISAFDTMGVTYSDGARDGDLDAIILATGYEIHVPCLPQMVVGMPPQGRSIPSRLFNSRRHIYPLARQIFPLSPDFPIGSLAFVGLGRQIVPFPWCEDQAWVAAKIFLHPESIDARHEQNLLEQRYARLSEEVGGDAEAIARRWHWMKDSLEQYEYRDELRKLVHHPEKTCPAWVTEGFVFKEVLREQWRDVLQCGEENKFMGATTEAEWNDVMLRLRKRAEMHSSQSTEAERNLQYRQE